MAREAGLTEERVAAINNEDARRTLPARYQAALAWADVLLAGGKGAPAEVVEELRRQFSAEEIVELTYAMATFIGYSKQIITLGMEPEHLDLTVVPTPGDPRRSR